MKLIKPKNKAEIKEKINPIEILKTRRSLVDTLTDELEKKEIIFFRPVELGGTLEIDRQYLTLPRDITETESRELGRYLNTFTQQRMYLRTLMGWQECALEEAKRIYYTVSNPIYKTLTKKEFSSETSKERYLNEHEDVKSTFLKYKDEKRKYDLLVYNLTSIDDAIFSISREISRRGGDFNTETRNENVQSKRKW